MTDPKEMKKPTPEAVAALKRACTPMVLQRLRAHLGRAAVELEQLLLPNVLPGRAHEVNSMLMQVFVLEAAVRGLGVKP